MPHDRILCLEDNLREMVLSFERAFAFERALVEDTHAEDARSDSGPYDARERARFFSIRKEQTSYGVPNVHLRTDGFLGVEAPNGRMDLSCGAASRY